MGSRYRSFDFFKLKFEQSRPYIPKSLSLMDRKRLRLKGISSTKTSYDVEGFAFYLAQIYPQGSELIDERNGEWDVNFNTDIGKIFLRFH